MKWTITALRILVVLGVLHMTVLVQNADAQKLLADGIEDLAGQISANVAKEQKRKIAVLPFRELDGRTTMLGAYLAEELVTRLFMTGEGLEIVERSMLDKVIEELRLGQTGLIDPSTAKEVGKVVGVDAVITGTITDLRSQIAVNCRLIDVQTGSVFGAAQTRIVKDDDVNMIIGVPIASAGSSGNPGKGGKLDKPPTASNTSVEDHGFMFEYQNCSSSGTLVTCYLLTTNRKEDRGLSLNAARLVDDLGNEYRAHVIPPGSSGPGMVRVIASRSQTLVSGVPVKWELAFKDVSSSARVARLLEITCGSPDGTFNVQMRDIPLGEH